MRRVKALPERVAVVSKERKLLSHVHPARARKLLKSGKAKVFSKKPLVLELIPEEERKGKQMKPMITNFTSYFSGEDRDVYVQNMSNTQVSMQFETSPGRYDSIPLPKTRRPFNLTQHIPFEAIKRSTDLRKLVNRRPPVLRLMTEEEYLEYYESLAKNRSTTPDEEILKAMEIQSNLMDRRVPVETKDEPKTIDQLKEEMLEDDEALSEMQPMPRIIGLCAQAGPQVDKGDKIKAEDMLMELETMEDELRATDLEYIQSHGYYKTVTKWASTRFSKLHNEDSE